MQHQRQDAADDKHMATKTTTYSIKVHARMLPRLIYMQKQARPQGRVYKVPPFYTVECMMHDVNAQSRSTAASQLVLPHASRVDLKEIADLLYAMIA
jgi:hypothetical protein